jgi:hypothetical protein
MTIKTIYEPPLLTFENIHDHCSTIATGLYKCIRCESKDIDSLFIIKYGLHHWFLCKKCSITFYEYVIDGRADNGDDWGREWMIRKYGSFIDETHS